MQNLCQNREIVNQIQIPARKTDFHKKQRLQKIIHLRNQISGTSQNIQSQNGIQWKLIIPSSGTIYAA